MTDEIHLFSDRDGVVIFGDQAAVDHFLAAESLTSRAVDMPRLSTVAGVGGASTQAMAELQANAGRWVKLTEKSAKTFKGADMMRGSEANAVRTVVTKNGKTSHILEIVQSPGTLLTNPAVLTGAAGIMAQLAMQQTMEEITDYLAAIDAKVEDVLRGQKDAVIADMIGVGYVIDEAMVIRDHVGHVSATTWSKVQGASSTIARTQAYALRQIDASAEKLDKAEGPGDLAKAAADAQASVHEWLAVLARCIQLQEGIGVLELDRVLEAGPEDLDRHRRGLHAARDNRLQQIATTTERLLNRLDTAAGTANAKVLLHPRDGRAIVGSRNVVTGQVVEFHAFVGSDHDGDPLEARRWLSAVADTRDRTLARGAEGVGAAKKFGGERLNRARSAQERISSRLPEVSVSIRRRHRDSDD